MIYCICVMVLCMKEPEIDCKKGFAIGERFF